MGDHEEYDEEDRNPEMLSPAEQAEFDRRCELYARLSEADRVWIIAQWNAAHDLLGPYDYVEHRKIERQRAGRRPNQIMFCYFAGMALLFMLAYLWRDYDQAANARTELAHIYDQAKYDPKFRRTLVEAGFWINEANVR